MSVNKFYITMIKKNVYRHIMWRPWKQFYFYAKMFTLKIEKMHFWSRAPSVISSCPSVKSTRAFCFMVKRGM